MRLFGYKDFHWVRRGEYPDSNKILLAPLDEIFDKNAQLNYFDGEENVRNKWKEIENKKE